MRHRQLAPMLASMDSLERCYVSLTRTRASAWWSRRSRATDGNHSLISGVAISMQPNLRSLLLAALTSLPICCIAQTAVTNVQTPDSKAICSADGPVLSDKDSKEIWLNTAALLKRAIHCKAPSMPAMARQARIEGQVLVDILVDTNGQVACARLISGHPLLVASAINAAKDWKFRPMKQHGKVVSFYGHLIFHFSTGGTAKDENHCIVAHW